MTTIYDGPYDQLADYEPMNDYEDQMDAVQSGYLSYDDTHCIHGRFVGNWAGPDYMCVDCEMGTPWEEYIEGLGWQAGYMKRKTLARQMFTELTDIEDKGISNLALFAWFQTKDWGYVFG